MTSCTRAHCDHKRCFHLHVAMSRLFLHVIVIYIEKNTLVILSNNKKLDHEKTAVVSSLALIKTACGCSCTFTYRQVSSSCLLLSERGHDPMLVFMLQHGAQSWEGSARLLGPCPIH